MRPRLVSTSSPSVACRPVAGSTTRAKSAIDNLRRICETELQGRYDLQVIDVMEQEVRRRMPSSDDGATRRPGADEMGKRPSSDG